ncbi:MAG: flagellar hook-basal body complex protein [Lachnospiraceae bacterium]|nr:flagellar hook-basal body complex protein [Lachnospiraceae bacterium]
MMRSLFSGVAGLKTHQTRMDVIGNNIANVNTVGYKSAQVTFRDLMYQNTSNATGPNDATGKAGVNAKQIGLGVTTAAIYSNIASAGAAETTGNPFDIRLNDSSFFLVNQGNQRYYTRSGAFTVDTSGTLCMSSNGFKVQGYQTETDATTGEVRLTGTVGDLKIMSDLTSPAKATTNGYITGILDSYDDALSSDNGKIVTAQIYDNEGFRYTISFSLKPTDTSDTRDPRDGKYTLSVNKLLDPDGNEVALTDAQKSGLISDGALEFDTTDGSLSTPTSGEVTVSMTSISGVNAAFTDDIVFDLSTLMNVDNKGTSTCSGGNGGTDNTTGSGWPVGTMSSVSVGTDGKITGSYTNGQTKLLGQIVTATFSNASGLEKAGENLYLESLNSGQPSVSGNGDMATGELEMSNVDLSSEFTSMITTQRGFQANSRIITVSDTLLEELINLKR